MQELHHSPDSTFDVPDYKTFRKDRSMTRRGTTKEAASLYLSKAVLSTLLSPPKTFPHMIPAPIIQLSQLKKGRLLFTFIFSMSHLSALLFLSSVLNLSHSFSYLHSLLPTFSAILTATIHPGTLTAGTTI